MRRPSLPALGLLLTALALAACDSETTRSPPELDVDRHERVLPRIVSFDANPEAVFEGDEVQLAWHVEDAAGVSITDASGASVALADPTLLEGTVSVTMEEKTRFTLTALQREGQDAPVVRSVTVDVIPRPAERPEIVSFEAAPPRVAPGEAVVLSWEVKNATALSLHDDRGGVVPVTLSERGQVTVHPDVETTYDLTVAGEGESVSESVTVAMDYGARIVAFGVIPHQPVDVGGEATIHWEVRRAQRVVIRDDQGTLLVDTTDEKTGTRTRSFDRNTLFTITATGADDVDVTANAQVQVGPSIDLFAASERIVRQGDPVRLTWRTRNADTLTLTSPAGAVLDVTAAAEIAEGEALVNVDQTGDFKLLALRNGVPREWQAYVEVTEAPRIRQLTVTPGQITAAADQPGSVTVAWVADGQTSCTLFRNNEVVWSGACADREGQRVVPVTEDCTFRLVATNSHGQHVAQGSVVTEAPARIPAFTVTPARRVHPGTTVRLAWETTDAVGLTLTKDGANLPIPQGATGFIDDVLVADATYVLTATNVLGDPTVRELPGKAGAPQVIAFDATPSFVAIGAPVTFDWQCDGGEVLELTDASGTVICTTAVESEIDDGSCGATAPDAPGEYTYTLTVKSGAGTAGELVGLGTLVLRASDGPMIQNFAASRTAISLGENTCLSWDVSLDAHGATPAIAIADDRGGTTSVAGKNPQHDQVCVTPAAEGFWTYTLTATTTGTTPATTSVTIEVGAAPAILTFTADPPLIYTQGGQVFPDVTLAWTTDKGVELQLFALDASGAEIPPALFKIAKNANDAGVAQGSFVVNPQATTSYLLKIWNRIGTLITKKVKVVVDPPEILTFEFNPTQILEGQTSTLTWATRNATSVSLEGRYSFVDISQTGGTKLALTGDDTTELYNFDPGFTFPFDGTPRTGCRISTNGWLGFDLTNTSSAAGNSEFTATNSTRYVNLAPFWDDLHSRSGGVWVKYDTVGTRKSLTIMWKDWGLYYYTPSNLNFEVVMWDDGQFDFHYGTMTSSSDPGAANGDEASIGWQPATSGVAGHHLVDYNTAHPDGLSNRGYLMIAGGPVNGSLDLSPVDDATFVLTARNADGEVTDTATLDVMKRPVLDTAFIQPSDPQAEVAFKIRWAAREATQIRVLDAAGNPICTTTDPAEIASGYCERTEMTGGYFDYVVEATNVLPTNTTTVPLRIYVFPLLALDSFDVNAEFVTSGTTVTATWHARGGMDVFLELCLPRTATCTPVNLFGYDPNNGSYSVPLTQSAEFQFAVQDTFGRSRTARKTVWVDAARITDFSATSTQIASGGSTTLNWTTNDPNAKVTLTGGTIAAPVEVSQEAPFVSVGPSGYRAPANGSSDSSYYEIVFPQGFAFPYYGQMLRAARAYNDGYLSFDMSSTSSNYTNYALPTSSYGHVNMLPFWDDTQYGSDGQIWYELGSDHLGRYLVIEWRNFDDYGDTSSDLNFEIVLRETGTFEYRYGVMYDSTAATAGGSEATIGYQNVGGTAGYQFSHNTRVTGDLQYRSWRYEAIAPAGGSNTVSPTETTDFTLCVTNASRYSECETVRVVVVKPGDVLFSELMVTPAAPRTDATGEWIELRNLSPDPIDLADFTLGSTGEAGHVFPTGGTAPVIPPGGYVVLSRADDTVNGGIGTDAVYGDAVILADAADEVTLTFAGQQIDKVAWAAGWPVAPGMTISLDPSYFIRATAANDLPAAWCQATAAYDGTNLGTPGLAGAGCRHALYDVDPAARIPFEDISFTGAPIAVGSNGRAQVATGLGFTMPYFAGTVTDLWVSKHGYLAFADLGSSTFDANGTIPSTTTPNGIVAPFWDKCAATDCAVRVETKTVATQQVTIVQWSYFVPDSSTGLKAPMIFQAQLWDDGDIAFVYREAPLGYAQYGGSSATIGIESPDGADGLQVSKDSATVQGERVVKPGRAILFRKK